LQKAFMSLDATMFTNHPICDSKVRRSELLAGLRKKRFSGNRESGQPVARPGNANFRSARAPEKTMSNIKFT
jgi:hypothetical protein